MKGCILGRITLTLLNVVGHIKVLKVFHYEMRLLRTRSRGHALPAASFQWITIFTVDLLPFLAAVVLASLLYPLYPLYSLYQCCNQEATLMPQVCFWRLNASMISSIISRLSIQIRAYLFYNCSHHHQLNNTYTTQTILSKS